jgi:hypothetical protein
MGKLKPVLDSILTVQDIQAWYISNPLPTPAAQLTFPLVETTQETWKTRSNLSLRTNEAADLISSLSTVPVAGRPGYKDIMGDMIEFGKGREMTAEDIEKFEKLKLEFATYKNATAAQQLVDYYGDDLSFVRNAMNSQMTDLCWSLVSNACNIEFVAANSPYFQGITAMDYAVEAWQKDAVATAWSDSSALILDDIESILDVGDDYDKVFTHIKLNKKWFNYVRKNEQIQKYAATLTQNLFSTQSPPTLAQINETLENYFDQPVIMEVVDEKITRASRDDVKTTANPFADGVAIFSQQSALGHFEWKKLASIDQTRETYESFFLVGNYKKIDPSYSKIYAKGKGFPVVDTYADNFYLKIDAVAW